MIEKQYVEDPHLDRCAPEEGNAPRTIRNRVDFFQIFLHYAKLPSLLTGKDLPQFTQKKVRAYNPAELDKDVRTRRVQRNTTFWP